MPAPVPTRQPQPEPEPEPEPQPQPQQQLCAFCSAKTVQPGFPYCSKTCGQNASKAGWFCGTPPGGGAAARNQGSNGVVQILCENCHVQGARTPLAHGLCPICCTQPLRVDKKTSKTFDYCGQACRAQAKAEAWVSKKARNEQKPMPLHNLQHLPSCKQLVI